MARGSAEDYLASLNAKFYFEDATSLMLKARPQRPAEFLLQYFEDLGQGQDYVVGREFSFVNGTTRNRAAFLAAFESAYGHFDDAAPMLVGDLHQLVALLCPGFPEGRVRRARVSLQGPRSGCPSLARWGVQ